MNSIATPDFSTITAGRHYAIFSDGACPGNPGRGGWGVLLQLREGDQIIKQAALAGHKAPLTTNICMEMTAALKGLLSLKKEPEIPALVITDNKMIVDAMTLGWFEKWKAAGWLKGRKPLINGDLWEKIDNAIGARVVHWHWIRGHAGHPQNEIADMLARHAAAGRYAKEGCGVRDLHGDLFF